MLTTNLFSGKKKLFILAITALVGYIFLSCVTKILFVEKFDPESADIEVTEYGESFLKMKYGAIPNKNLPWWDDPQLGNCKNSTISDTVLKVDYKKFSVLGNCGYRSSLKGSNQNILSFSLYGKNETYWSILNETLNDSHIYYPGWQVRIYVNPRIRKVYLCEILLLYPHVSICDVENLPPPLGNLAAADPMLWRSAPMGDSTVSRFAVRDSDSAVSILINQSRLFHHKDIDIK